MQHGLSEQTRTVVKECDLTMCEQSKFCDSPEFGNNNISNTGYPVPVSTLFGQAYQSYFLEHHMGFVQPMSKQESLTLHGGSEADAVYTLL